LFNKLGLLRQKAIKLPNEPASDRRGDPAPRKVTGATVFWVLLAVAIIALGAWQQRQQAEQQARQIANNDQQVQSTSTTASSASADEESATAETRRRTDSQSNSSPSASPPYSSVKRETSADRRALKGDATSDREQTDYPPDRRPANSSTTAESKNGRTEQPHNTAQPAKPLAQRVIVPGMKIKDLEGRIVYEGPIDLTDTLERISAGEQLRFRNDGSVFGNRERRLPPRQARYYREWVHPTPELDGPGPQRVVTGEKGEIYYTHDHYRTFKKLK
jgi:ribonuclease T1